MNDSNQHKEAIAARLREDIVAVVGMRRESVADPVFHDAVVRLKAWQAERLAGTYADLLASERYRPATEFFLSDLYGPGDFRGRDEGLARVIPAMCRMLPAGALHTIGTAVRLDRLSESLDRDVAQALRKARSADRIDAPRYAEAYRAAGRREAREEQIALTLEIGQALDELTSSRSVRMALVLMRKPAHAAGFGELQDFLERGFGAFRHMHGAAGFLATVTGREREVMQRLFAGEARPFDVERVPQPV